MKPILVLAALIIGAAFIIGTHTSTAQNTPAAQTQAASQRKQPPEVLTLATDSRLGPVTFNHKNHITKNYNIAGTGPIACVECHHTAQPESEVLKHPPLKTAWPANRTSTLTAENVMDSNTPAVVACRDCHARAGATPKIWPEIPQIKYEGSTAMVLLTNQQAFHRNCASCHDEVMKTRTDLHAPKTQQCTGCHKRGATTTGD